ncbi:MAG: endonuclease domain-containing protein [SAR202 cluster bacterium]|nr:endonuclease domain-containing protein [SAR202 cluster bacterium]
MKTDKYLTELARDMRRSMTPAEFLLWKHINNRQLNGLKFRRQQPIQNYIADFACKEIKLIIELDGGQHSGPEAIVSDTKRTEHLEANGWKVVRFWNNDVTRNLEGVMAELIRITEKPALTGPDEASGPPLPQSRERNHTDSLAD